MNSSRSIARKVIVGAALFGLVSGCGSGSGGNVDEALPDAAATSAATDGPAGDSDARAPGGNPAIGEDRSGGGAGASSAPSVANPKRSNGNAEPANATPNSRGAGPTVAPAAAPCTTTLAPIKIGQVGGFSGIVGQSGGNLRTGLAVWAKYVNDRGGIQCHPIQVFAVDDQSDPAKSQAAVVDLVRSKGVVALVGANIPLDAPGYRSGVEKVQVPAVGGDLITTDWNESQYFFPQGTSGRYSYPGGAAELASATGKKQLGIIVCVEASICPTAAGYVKDPANQALGGYQVVASAQSSLTQTDYTAECQNFKNAGAEMLWVGLDASSVQRLARSCQSIGYEVPFAAPSLSISSGLLEDPNLNRNGVYITSPTQPFTESDSPALRTFHEAMNAYAPTVKLDQSAMLGWSSGMLFKAAIDAVPETRSGVVTTPMVFKGLYALKNETMGGLGPGVTFREGQPAPLVKCYYILLMKGGQFSGPKGSKRLCL